MVDQPNVLEAPGDIVNTPLTIGKARDLAAMLREGKIEYAQYVECRETAGGEVVVFDVEVELGQLKVNDIRRFERIAAEFFSDDMVMPDVLALRADFPLVPHINLRTVEFPRSLCLYDRPYRELKRQWTAPQFVERIREWLRLTAKGKLHGEDQPLEPLLVAAEGMIVIPYALTLVEDREQFRPLYVTATSMESGDAFYVARATRPNKTGKGVPFAACVLSCTPQQHGVIRRQPETLADLAEMVGAAGLDLLPALRKQMSGCKEEMGKEVGPFLDAPLIVIVRFPKTRVAGGEEETTDVFVFLTFQSVLDVGTDIGLWEVTTLENGQRSLGGFLVPPHDKTGSNVTIKALNPVYEFHPVWANLLSGQEIREEPKMVAIGAGALGSQVIMNAARGGFGLVWQVIDEDRLYPHNLVRHALNGTHVGFHKAETICRTANSLSGDEELFTPIVADVLRAGDNAEKLSEALRDADTILDMSASVTVSRHLVHAVESEAQRISLFLNPSGEDLVLLAEAADRKIPLDALEMQYYRAIVNSDEMAGHFEAEEDRRRYGQSCRDVTVKIPQELVALHAAIGTRAVRLAARADKPQISLWRSSPDHSVKRVEITPTPVRRMKLGEWTLSVDGHVFDTLAGLRESKLPNETGGVLLGSFDLERKTAYIVDTIPSPPDSEEWPTLYIRGCKGLEHHVKAIHKRTDGMLHYVGEWHSHPDGCSTQPSDDDMLVFAWLTERMNSDGFPALMMIAGEAGAMNCFIGKMERVENLIPVPD